MDSLPAWIVVKYQGEIWALPRSKVSKLFWSEDLGKGFESLIWIDDEAENISDPEGKGRGFCGNGEILFGLDNMCCIIRIYLMCYTYIKEGDKDKTLEEWFEERYEISVKNSREAEIMLKYCREKFKMSLL